jgi:hypothetical protein
LSQLQFKQLGDTMWIVHSDYAPRKLTRTSAYVFSLDTIEFTKGPFLERNDLDNDNGVTLVSSVTAADATGTLTASVATFQSGHVGSIWELTQHRTDTKVSIQSTANGESSAIDVKGTFTFVTHDTWSATITLERNEDSQGWETYRTWIGVDDTNVSQSFTEEADNVQYKIVITDYASGNINADITVNESTQMGVVRIDSVASSTIANITVLSKLATTSSTVRWAEGAWSDVRGFPAAMTFFEDRAVYGGTAYEPQKVWLSEVGDYENFEEDVNDADSFSLVITTTNQISWIDGLEAMIIGTSGDEWAIASNKLGSPLTPSNFSVRLQSTYGNAQIGPIRVRKSILFLDMVRRKLRELTYDPTADEYVSPDLAVLAEHITQTGIQAITLQRNPELIIWAVRTDGILLSLTYEREQEVVAWARHPMSGVVKSVCVIPGDDEDQVWIVAKRGSLHYIECMGQRNWTDRTLMVYSDSAVQYAGSSTSVITGLDHLEGTTVSILGDGADMGTGAVQGGSVTLPTSVTRAVVGVPFRYTAQPMRIEWNQNGSTHGSYTRISEVVLSLWKTLGVQYGNTTSTLYPIPSRSEEVYDSPPDLFTGDVAVAVPGGFDPDVPFLISGNDSNPCTVRAILARVTATGR